jgi:hypothetical protein
MGFGLGSIVSVVTDPGKVVKDVVDAVLPEQLDVVADLAGAAASWYSGRPLQALGHLQQAMRDLPQAFEQGTAQGAAARAGGSWRKPGSANFEPTPPPARAAGTFDIKKLLSLMQQIIDAVGGKKPASTSGKTEDADDSEGASSGSSSKTSSSSSSSSSSAKKDTALDKLNKLSDAEFMAKIRKGDLPKEITDDPKAMLAIQERVRHISEMTKLMSQMMQALHDMQMSILQNVRA